MADAPATPPAPKTRIDNFFASSWKTTVAGVAYFCWEVGHEAYASMHGHPFEWRAFGRAAFGAALGYFARDWNKTSEDEGLKPNSLSAEAIKGIVNSMLFGTGSAPKLLLPFILAASLCCASSAFAMLNAELHPNAVPVNVHDNANVEVKIPPKAISGEATDSFKLWLTGQIGSKTGPLVYAPATASTTAPLVNVSAPFTTAPHTIDAPVNFNTPLTAPKTVCVEGNILNVRLMDADAARELAAGLKALAEPLRDIKNEASNAEHKAEAYAMYFAGACFGLALVLGVAYWFKHRAHNELKAQLAQKELGT